MNNWDDMRIFHAVAETGSLSAAGRQLNISQPTVGRRIEALEQQFGATLFARGPRGLDLTETGQAVLEHAHVMEREFLSARTAAEGHSQNLVGDVVMSVPEGIGTVWLPKVMGEFHARYPDIVIHLTIEARTANLVRREADIALRFGGPGNQATTLARRGLTMGFGFYAAQSYLDRRGAPESLTELADHDTVWASFGTGAIWPSEINGAPVTPGRIVFDTNSPGAHIAAVEAGWGIGALSHRWAAEKGRLVRLLPDISAMTLELWLVTHRELRTSARLRAVFDFLVEAMARDSGFLERGELDAPASAYAAGTR